jgi:hypothetical protein
MSKKIKDRRKHGRFVQFILDMHSGESNVSWMRWMGTVSVTNIMLVWTASCIFDANWKVNFTLEDMPLGLVAIVTTMVAGKVGQALVDRKEGGG